MNKKKRILKKSAILKCNLPHGSSTAEKTNIEHNKNYDKEEDLVQQGHLKQPASTEDDASHPPEKLVSSPSATRKPNKQTKLKSTPLRNVGDLKRKLKLSQGHISRLQSKCDELTETLNIVKEYTNNSEVDNILNGNYEKLCRFINKGRNIDTKDTCTEEVMKFAVTIHCLSPETYDYLSQFIELPDKSYILEQMSSGSYDIHIAD